MLTRSRLLLAEDAVLSPSVQVGLDVHLDQAEPDAEDWILVLPGGRIAPKLVCPHTAALLRRFRSPVTIVEAVARHAKETGQSTDDILNDTYRLLHELTQAGVLVAEGHSSPQRHLVPGQDLGFCRVLDAVRELKDVDIYRVALPPSAGGSPAALKIASVPRLAYVQLAMDGECEYLRRLDGNPTPRVLGHGEREGRPYLLLEWIQGISLRDAGRELREVRWPARRKRILRLLLGVVTAYARLHQEGLLHGDVHPDNILVTRDGAVRLLDLGLAVTVGPKAQFLGGIPFYYSPEVARAMRASRGETEGESAEPANRHVSISPLAEQYSVVATCFEAVTGHKTHDFSLMEDELLRQVEVEPPLCFSHLGIEPWPELEAVFLRALAKSPEDRYPTLLDLGQALANLVDCDDAPLPNRPSEAASQCRALLARLDLDGDLYEAGLTHAPTASVGYGAAGVALTLSRIAAISEEPRLGAAAIRWSRRALSELEQPSALAVPEEPMSENATRNSVLHGRIGPLALAWLVSPESLRDVMGFEPTLIHAVEGAGAGDDESSLDFALGAPGLLTLCAEIHAMHGSPELTTAADALATRIWRAAREACFGEARPRLAYLGMAHGWSGLLQGLLRWSECRASAVSVSELGEGLEKLAELRIPDGRGARWPIEIGGVGHMAGWCHGVAGMVALWLTAWRVLGDARYLELALDAGYRVADCPESNGTLCCGRAGQALSLLSLFEATGDHAWLARAEHLAQTAFLLPLPREEHHVSLMKGKLGMVLAMAEVERGKTGIRNCLRFPAVLA